ncbi:MAG: hypothetical protein ACXW4H_06940 [Candidatus Limnocylindrales bacterium]
MREPLPPHLDPPGAASLLASLGFVACSDLPDRPGPAYLLVAFRPEPTLRHYDPETVTYWVTQAGRGTQRVLARETELPVDCEFTWGLIRIVDRLKVSNEYLTFGGHLAAASIQDTTIAVFTSPTPLLRRGGHSQGWDHGAESVGAFFARLQVAVDYNPGFEARLADAGPLARYAAFLNDIVVRYRSSSALRSGHPELWTLFDTEERRLRRDHPVEWDHGSELLAAAEVSLP